MAWETRNGRGRYYTRSLRIGGRVARQYLGNGLGAELAASEDAQRRSQWLDKRETWNRRREEMQATSEALERFTAGVRAFTRSTLEAAGYHQHHRGEWRRRLG